MERLCSGNPEPLALSHSEMRDAVVTGEHLALLADDVAGLRSFLEAYDPRRLAGPAPAPKRRTPS
jgi:hypothetical protein